MQAVGRKKTNVHWSGNYHLDQGSGCFFLLPLSLCGVVGTDTNFMVKTHDC